ncbi:hypothetical protein EYF80_052292 [Liparis tanakae]|uniref:Uncharacterized protein n=1 Tax=Liparis tanakae TaxID=230148 RepID=A0A4Z2F9K1_9TELE|nr:hypothetical protein EYF80_052292 [Liparis tanakae]
MSLCPYEGLNAFDLGAFDLRAMSPGTVDSRSSPQHPDHEDHPGPEEAVVTYGPASLQHRSTQAAKLNTNSLPLQINGTPFLSFPLPSLPSSTPVSSPPPLVQHHRRTTYSLPSGAGSIAYDGAQALTPH